MNQRHTLKKAEKLKSRKSIELLFREGKSLSVFPFKAFYLVSSRDQVQTVLSAATGPAARPPGSAARPPGSPAPLQAGFGVSARLFPKAVDRNRIKRLTREAWRLQRHPLSATLREKGLSMTIFLIYTGKQLPDYQTVTQKIGVALQKLIKATA